MGIAGDWGYTGQFDGRKMLARGCWGVGLHPVNLMGVKCLQGVAGGWDYTRSVCWDQGRSLSVVCQFAGGREKGEGVT